MKALLAGCFLAVSPFPAAAAPAPEVVLTEGWGHLERASKAMLLDGNFDELTATAQRYRGGEKLPDGSWKLEYLYTGCGRGADAAEWQRIFAALDAWAEHEKEDPAPIIAMADAFHSFGKQARGTGFADTVTAEGWKLLNERIAKGRDILKDHEERCRTCPGYYSVMMKIGIDGSTDRAAFMKLFDDAVKLAPDYLAFYELKSYYILPQWYGREGELREFVETLSEDRPRAGMWVLWRLQRQGVYINVIKDIPIPWQNIRQPLLGAIGENDVAGANITAYLADVAGDGDTVFEALARAENRLDSWRWRDRGRMDAIHGKLKEMAEK